ncbi:hypothetical protein [Lentzea jiangxiensis]|uniref:Uncharacterized protein n=1 Tax=Lentzea jiangxiensis TaxID=641025 RepID=A0A1H0ETL7_9PSEU|nr:hypothetical protein [Lentzea jiangxiensis]SDN85666.1 hypothetical protein SAMN05421507_101513 [Lentzea jiangxiensis]
MSKIVAPYVTAWSAEQDLPCVLVERPDHSIGYASELVSDRDRLGVLWRQTSLRRHVGQPEFARLHPRRQRRAMELLLCQVCGGPADQNDDGVLWLCRDHRDDWPQWPDGMASVEPPICSPCVPVATRMCPALHRGAVAVRVKDCPVVGVRGVLYAQSVLAPVAADAGNFTYGDPAVRRVLASALIRELRGCVVVPLDEVSGTTTGDVSRSGRRATSRRAGSGSCPRRSA